MMSANNPPDPRNPKEQVHPPATNPEETRTPFESAAEEEPLSLGREFLLFLKDNKKWWLLPILIVIGLVAALAFFTSSTGLAPFIYPMF